MRNNLFFSKARNKTVLIVILSLTLSTTPKYQSSATMSDSNAFKRKVLDQSRMRNMRFEQIKDSLKKVIQVNWIIALETQRKLELLLKNKNNSL